MHQRSKPDLLCQTLWQIPGPHFTPHTAVNQISPARQRRQNQYLEYKRRLTRCWCGSFYSTAQSVIHKNHIKYPSNTHTHKLLTTLFSKRAMISISENNNKKKTPIIFLFRLLCRKPSWVPEDFLMAHINRKWALLGSWCVRFSAGRIL